MGQVLTTQWTYDSADQVVSMTYPDGEVVGYTYLPQGGVASVGGYLAGTRVNANGQRDLMTFGNGTQTSFTYKDWLTDGGRLGTLQSGLPDTLVNLSLGYDPAGNITQITDGLNAGQVQSFSYDTLNRLTETGTNSVGEGQYSQTYTYDPATGNLSSKSDLGDYTYSPTQPHAVTQAGTNSYAYDQNGNMTSRTVSGMVWTYIYNAENQLAQVKKNDQLISEYGYDGDGKRVWAKDYEGFLSTNPKVTRYIGNYYEVRVEGYKPDSGGAPSQSCSAPSYCAYFPFIARTLVENVSYYYADGQRIAMKNNGVVTYLYGDQLGSTTATADVNGNPVSQTLYHPWGTNRFSQGTSPTDYTYTGQRQEGDIYFYNARWYDPQLGRFMQADTIVPIAQGTQGFDRYAYVNNNPLIFNDPSGHRFCEDNYAKGCNVASSAFTLQFTFGSYNFGFGKANNIDRYNDDVISPSVISSNPFVIFVSLIDFFGRILQDFSPISDTDYRGPQVNWLVISEDYGEMIKIKNIHLVSDDTVTLERISIYRNTSRVSLFNFRPSTIANLEYGFDTGEVGTYEVDPLIVDLTPQSLLLEFRLKCYECAGNKGLNSFGYNPYPFIPTTNLSYIRDWRSKNER